MNIDDNLLDFFDLNSKLKKIKISTNDFERLVAEYEPLPKSHLSINGYSEVFRFLIYAYSVIRPTHFRITDSTDFSCPLFNPITEPALYGSVDSIWRWNDDESYWFRSWLIFMSKYHDFILKSSGSFIPYSKARGLVLSTDSFIDISVLTNYFPESTPKLKYWFDDELLNKKKIDSSDKNSLVNARKFEQTFANSFIHLDHTDYSEDARIKYYIPRSFLRVSVLIIETKKTSLDEFVFAPNTNRSTIKRAILTRVNNLVNDYFTVLVKILPNPESDEFYNHFYQIQCEFYKLEYIFGVITFIQTIENMTHNTLSLEEITNSQLFPSVFERIEKTKPGYPLEQETQFIYTADLEFCKNYISITRQHLQLLESIKSNFDLTETNMTRVPALLVHQIIIN